MKTRRRHRRGSIHDQLAALRLGLRAALTAAALIDQKLLEQVEEELQRGKPREYFT